MANWLCKKWSCCSIIIRKIRSHISHRRNVYFHYLRKICRQSTWINVIQIFGICRYNLSRQFKWYSRSYIKHETRSQNQSHSPCILSCCNEIPVCSRAFLFFLAKSSLIVTTVIWSMYKLFSWIFEYYVRSVTVYNMGCRSLTPG